MDDKKDPIAQSHRRETEEETATTVETIEEQKPDHTSKAANESARVGHGFGTDGEKPVE